MFEDSTPYDILTEKWNPVLNHDAVPAIDDVYKKKVTAVLLENQEAAMRQQYLTETSANGIGGGFGLNSNGSANTNLQGYDPILISLVRRAMPNLMAYDIAGVQPMTAPTGLIFAMRSKYDSQSGEEALFAEPFAKFSGSGATSTGASTDPLTGVAPLTLTGVTTISKATIFGSDFIGISTSRAEDLGGSGNPFKEMAFAIDRIAVTAKTRALKAEYTTELAQDLKAVHGLDAETELANILSTEILAEMNREVIRNIYWVAKLGCQQSDLRSKDQSGTGGAYDLSLDSDGRWSAERFRGLMFQIEREANVIAKDTRRGKGNFIICSSDVASALTMGGFLQLTPAPATQLEVDDTGNTFAGILNGKMRVYIDPYSSSTQNFVCVGYRGASPYDAGIFYCPYVPLQMVRAVDPDTFQPKIGFKTRYGMVQNPFVRSGGNPVGSQLTENVNQYYRLFAVTNIHGNTGN
jgi:Major capsid protein Gp23